MDSVPEKKKKKQATADEYGAMQKFILIKVLSLSYPIAILINYCYRKTVVILINSFDNTTSKCS